MSGQTLELLAIATTDLAAIVRGRSIRADRLDSTDAGVGWCPANLSLTPFGTIVDPNPWGTTGDVRLVPDRGARYRTVATGSPTPFDVVMAYIRELDGSPWPCCPRGLLKQAVDALCDKTGLTLKVAFEQEFQLFDTQLPLAHALSIAAMRQTDPFAPRLAAALEEAGIDPETLLAEFGRDQLEVTCTPADPITAADRAVAIREITRELARTMGWRASFAPKTAPQAVGNGVHIHFSLVDAGGKPATYSATGLAGLSDVASQFCAGILRHLPALTALTAPSTPSYYRLKPNSWSASWTWLADRDREASLRICPVTTIGGRQPAPQYNIEYRAADATANPYLAIAAIIRAGLTGIVERMPPPPVVAEHPEGLDAKRRKALGLERLPDGIDAALQALREDAVVTSWFPPDLLAAFNGVRQAEIARLKGLSAEEVCALYRELY
jgi:glutamine synthetase